MYFRLLRDSSLKTRITVASLLIFLVGIWSLSIYMNRILRADFQRILGDKAFEAVSMIASQVDRELARQVHVLKETAALADTPLRVGPEAMQAFLEARPDLPVIFGGGVFVTHTNGTAVAAYPFKDLHVGVNFADRDYLVGALIKGEPTIGRPVISKTDNAPVIVVATPIFGTHDAVIGAMAGVTNLRIADFLDQITQGHYGKRGGFVLFSSQYHLIIAASDKRLAMRDFPKPGVNPLIDGLTTVADGSGVMTDLSGEEVLYSVTSIPSAGWQVAAFLPTAEAFAPIGDLQRHMWLATIIMTLLAGALIWWVLGHLLSPLSVTAKVLATFSDTGQPVRPLSISRHDEIGTLVGGFNRLLETLARRERDLREREEYFRLIFEYSGDAILFSAEHGPVESANPAACRLFGYSEDELRCLGPSGIVDRSDKRALAALRRRRRTGHYFGELRCVHRDGRMLIVEANSTSFTDSRGAKHSINLLRDISERKQTEQKLHLAANVFSHAREGIVIAAPSGTIVDVNDSFVRLTGFSRDEVLGKNPSLLKSGRHDETFYTALWASLRTKGHWYGEIWNRRKNGETFVAMQTISAIRDSQGNILQYVGLFSDITELKEHEKQLEHMAYYDVLTGLPNRALLSDRLHQSMIQEQRRGMRLAVVYLDLDGFKAVNDRYGHRTGDRLLIELSQRMKQTLREGDTFARLGGDEFVAVLLDVLDHATCTPTLNRLLAAAAQPLLIGEVELQVSASLGVTLYPQEEAVDADQLLRQADQAMYQAKQAGRNRYHFFDADKDRNERGHHENLERIGNALAAREFVMYFQPKVNMRSGAIVGAEALIRWQHPQLGLLPPAHFLPAIEEQQLAVEVGEWVIESVLTQMEEWKQSGLDLPISINVGARQLLHGDFALRLREILARHPTVCPGDLEIEILETSALEDLNRVSRIIEDCRALGVSFSLDDFGTGYSSLTYLKRLSVGTLKIDQSFVREMIDDPENLSILVGILNMANAFRRQVIAEGVETIEHGILLLQLGCELAQGYGIAHPMPAADMQAWKKAWPLDLAWMALRT